MADLAGTQNKSVWKTYRETRERENTGSKHIKGDIPKKSKTTGCATVTEKLPARCGNSNEKISI